MHTGSKHDPPPGPDWTFDRNVTFAIQFFPVPLESVNRTLTKPMTVAMPLPVKEMSSTIGMVKAEPTITLKSSATCAFPVSVGYRPTHILHKPHPSLSMSLS